MNTTVNNTLNDFLKIKIHSNFYWYMNVMIYYRFIIKNYNTNIIYNK
jgi:hypothetical protein